MPHHWILASASPYRAELLKQFNCPFDIKPAHIDERVQDNENIKDYVARLAHAKAFKIAEENPESIVIGSDQALIHQDRIIGKPKDKMHAKALLAAFSGECITSYTALTLLSPTHPAQHDIVLTEVRFRTLSDEQIEAYLTKEPDALNCAGACKVETLGIALCANITSADPSALVGLPLISLTSMLNNIGAHPLMI